MLSPRREGVLAGDAEEEELEEGEARPDGDGDGEEDFFDPDVVLSYIDEKLQHVLGHFQKDFEGGVSADNLGPKFGGYGSFLPTYKHSPPLLSQTRSPKMAANIITSRSPYQPSAERMDRNLSTVAVESISPNNGAIVHSTSEVCKKEGCSSTNSEESVVASDSLYSSLNGSDPKSLKVQMKVGSNNVLPRKNASIYSGLGLDVSSSSSMEESPDGIGGLSPEFSNVPYESPRTILQVMTCFPVPGGFMLSPLHDNILQLTNKVAPLLKKWETHLVMENVPKALEGRFQSAVSPGHFGGHVAKQLESGNKKAESYKDLGENLPNRSQQDMEEVLLENRSAKGEIRKKERMMNISNENDFYVASARKEIPTSLKHEQFPVSEEQLHMPSSSGIAIANAAPVPESAVIEDHWVCCDICQKWRLLPYGTNPSMLPKKWKCSMLYWLPGMNRCDINEDETTNALNALYVIPVPDIGASSGGPHSEGGGTTTLSSNNVIGQLKQSRKRKTVPSDGNGQIESSYHTPVATPLMSNQQKPNKPLRTVDDDNYIIEIDSVSKHGPRQMSKSADLVSEKQKSKHKNHNSYPEREDLKERTKAHSKLKTKRGIDQNEHKTFKKTKKEDQHQIDRDWDHECYSAGGKITGEPKAMPAKAKAMKVSLETHDISLHKEKMASRYDLEQPKRINDVRVPIHREKEECTADVERLDLFCKKIVKEREENQLDTVNTVSNKSKNKNSKEKKSNILNPEEMALKVNNRPEKAGRCLNHKFVAGKEGSPELWENAPATTNVAYLQSSTAATSSSSKISSSRRNNNSQETKDSPVESVSSSPLRNFNIEKTCAQKDGIVNAYSGTINSSVKYSGTEVGELDTDQHAGNIEERKAAGKSIFHGCLQGSSDSNNKEIAQSSQAQVSEITYLERVSGNNLQNATTGNHFPKNDNSVGTGEGHLSSSDKKYLDMERPSQQPDQLLFDRRAIGLDTGLNVIAQDNKTNALHQGCGSGQQLGISIGGGEKIRISNQDIQKPVAQHIHFPIKEGKKEVHPTSVKFDASKTEVQSRRSSVKNGVQHGTVGQAGPKPSAASPIRKDGRMVAFALKEARDLKHKANHMKNKGLELESTGLYFEAALKFLHVAFLLETPNFDSSRPGDAAQSMKMYSETAKLCNFCAHEYERSKKMAAAALAYKCVEVACLKAAYYKYPSASKDQQELQAVVRIAPGESPSSSASDVDIIHSHGLSRAPLTKDGSSPLVAGNHLPLAVCNQVHLLRLLAYTNDVNGAFNATRKSQVAIISAAGSQEKEKGVDDGLASVKSVLDFNFNNVNELLRLVRLSMESISI